MSLETNKFKEGDEVWYLVARGFENGSPYDRLRTLLKLPIVGKSRIKSITKSGFIFRTESGQLVLSKDNLFITEGEALKSAKLYIENLKAEMLKEVNQVASQIDELLSKL